MSPLNQHNVVKSRNIAHLLIKQKTRRIYFSVQHFGMNRLANELLRFHITGMVHVQC